MAIVGVALLLAAAFLEPARAAKPGEDMMSRWNTIAIEAAALDHTPPTPTESRAFGEQAGPVRTSRALAIVHLAVFEALNAISGKYQSQIGFDAKDEGASVDSAIAQAAHDTLNSVFPAQGAHCDKLLAEDLAVIPNILARNAGIIIGQRAAAAVLARRSSDGANHAEPQLGIDFFTSNEPGYWRQDPISRHPLALGARWSSVRPFILDSADQFRSPPPPRLDSRRYAAAYDEVNRLGGDGVVTPTERTREQTEIGVFWGYDGTPNLGTPPRLYNQIAMKIAEIKGTTDPLELARLLALVNVAMADTGLAIWESKYFYQFWRPVTGIRESDPRSENRPDARFMPLGAPASNQGGVNFTPPFPAYPSGHAGFGAALFQTLRRFYDTDNIPFKFVSDELNGVTKDANGMVRPRVERSFPNLVSAEEENGQSRIYLGIHWIFDKSEGIHLGRRVADYVFDNAFLPR